MRRVALLAALARRRGRTAQAAPASGVPLPTAMAQPRTSSRGPTATCGSPSAARTRSAASRGATRARYRSSTSRPGGMRAGHHRRRPRRGALVHGAGEQQRRAACRRAIRPAYAFAGMGIVRRAGSRSARTATCGWPTPTPPAPDVHRISPAGAAVGTPIPLPRASTRAASRAGRRRHVGRRLQHSRLVVRGHDAGPPIRCGLPVAGRDRRST